MAVLNVLIALGITVRIFRVRARVTENQDALLWIGLLYITFMVVTLLLLISELVKGISHTLCYQIRIVKNASFLLVALFYYLGIIAPSRKKN